MNLNTEVCNTEDEARSCHFESKEKEGLTMSLNLSIEYRTRQERVDVRQARA